MSEPGPLRKAFMDSTGAYSVVEGLGTLALLTYLGLVIASGKVPDGRDFAFVVGGILTSIAGGQLMRGDPKIDMQRQMQGNGNADNH